MNLPDWATHVAVDADGMVCVFEGEPKWSEDDSLGGAWIQARAGQKWERIEDDLPHSVARLLCVEIPRTPTSGPEKDDA